MLDGAARLTELFAETAGGHGRPGHDRPRQRVRRLRLYAKAKAGIKPIIGMEAYLTPNTSRFERTRVRWANRCAATTCRAAARSPT